MFVIYKMVYLDISMKILYRYIYNECITVSLGFGLQYSLISHCDLQ